MLRRRRHSFTLPELLIALSLVLSVGASLSFGFKKAIDGERFRAAVDRMAAKMRLAEELSLLFQADAEVEIRESEEGVSLFIDLAAPLTPSLRGLLAMPPSPEIRHVESAPWIPILSGYVQEQTINLEGYSSAALLITNQPLQVKVLSAGQKVPNQPEELARHLDDLFPQEIYEGS
ncbi:MAG: hypothetical protein K0S07_911 [Chlamydiales bacterium]|jgi:type II secretory pathway pseudopilin PulG|nr:hypothetical protein [Chlamydiales bacterium]